MKARFISALNPLRFTGLALPPVLVLVARFIAFVLIIRGDAPFERYLPYLDFLDTLGSAETFTAALGLMALTGYVLLFVTPLVRSGCLLVGSAFLLGLLGCRPCLSVAHTYVAIVFLVLALSSHSSGTWLLRLQVFLLYAGACLNKMLDVDWWNGQYFETLMIIRHEHELYTSVAALLPPKMLSTIMGILTIVIQCVLSLCFLRRRWYLAGVILGLVFHGTMVMLLNGTFGPFFLAICISYMAFIEWPERIEISLPEFRWKARLQSLVSALDVDRVFYIVPPSSSRPDGMALSTGTRRYRGTAALQRLIFYLPISFFLVAFLISQWRFSSIRGALLIVLAVAFSPLAAKFGDALSRRMRAATKLQ